MKMRDEQGGFTLPELIVTMVVFAIVAFSVYTLLTGYITSSAAAQLKSIAVEVATEEMESLRSVAYNDLAVAGGSIVSAGTYLPATQDVTRAARHFIVVTDVRYIDDAYDGCFSYASTAQRDAYCRNSPPLNTLPVDNNPKDYKVIQVTVKDKSSGSTLSVLSSYASARVAEVASNTALISVKVTNMSGSGVAGATVRILNNTVSPVVDQTITTDDLGSAIFMDVKPDAGNDYVITASKSGYSSLTTTAASGVLIPTYPNVSAIAQNMTNATLMINPVSSTSLLAKIVDTNGNAVTGASVAIRGGIKTYTDTADTTYGYNATSISGSDGTVALGSLVPGPYQVVSVSGKHVVSVHTAVGASSFQPFDIPPGQLPTGGLSAMQSIVVVTSTSASYPAIYSISPTSVSNTDPDISSIEIACNGDNLSSATMRLVGKSSGTVIVGTVTATSDTSGKIIRSFDLSSAPQEGYRVELIRGSNMVTQDSVAPNNVGAFSVGH